MNLMYFDNCLFCKAWCVTWHILYLMVVLIKPCKDLMECKKMNEWMKVHHDAYYPNKHGEILNLLIWSFLLCLSWLLHCQVWRFQKDLWITLYIIVSSFHTCRKPIHVTQVWSSDFSSKLSLGERPIKPWVESSWSHPKHHSCFHLYITPLISMWLQDHVAHNHRQGVSVRKNIKE
jgi:hypothetical protein